MIDLHTHSIFSDGELIPAELVRRAVAIGYEAIAITDHMDHSNIELIIPMIVKFVKAAQPYFPIPIIPGAEITHVPPSLVSELVREARRLGAKVVVVHGETIVEPVMVGTNRAAIEADADILAHPGLISYDDLMLAREKSIALEITFRKGHCLTNGYVAKWATELGVPIVVNTDAHSPSDLITKELASKVLKASGIDDESIKKSFQYSKYLVDKSLR